jgi:hypothetical protein
LLCKEISGFFPDPFGGRAATLNAAGFVAAYDRSRHLS